MHLVNGKNLRAVNLYACPRKVSEIVFKGGGVGGTGDPEVDAVGFEDSGLCAVGNGAIVEDGVGTGVGRLIGDAEGKADLRRSADNGTGSASDEQNSGKEYLPAGVASVFWNFG